MSDFDVALPWNSVLKSSAMDSEFWDRELKEPAMLYMVGHGRNFPSHVERMPELRQDGRDQGAGRKRKRNGGGGPPEAAANPARRQG